MSKNKDLVIKADEIGNLIFDEDTVEILNKFKKDMNVISRILRYGKETINKKERFGKTKICQIINLKPKECEFIKLTGFDLCDLAWITTKILAEEENVKPLIRKNEKKFFNGSVLKKVSDYECSFNLKIGEKLFTDRPQSLIVDDRYLLLPQLLTDEYGNRSHYYLWIVCKIEDKEKVYKEVKNLIKKYQILKNQIIHADNDGLTIISEFCKFSIDQVAISEEFQKEINLIINFAKNFDKFVEKGVKTKRGILIHGVPGTGKTITIKALSDEFKKNGGTVFYYFKDDFAAFAGGYSISEIYKMANDCVPSMVILEDFDLMAAARRHNDRQTSSQYVTNELLKLLEDSKESENVVTIATTNILEGLDEAAIRHGRIDRVYLFDYPNYDLKIKILKEHLSLYNVNLNSDKIINQIEHVLQSDITGATIMSIVRSTVQLAISEMREVTYSDFDFATNHIKLKKLDNTIF